MKNSNIKNEYTSFKDKIKKEIKNNKVSYHINDCFLIRDSLSQELKNNKAYDLKNSFFGQKFGVQKDNILFINNQSFAITSYKYGYNLELVSKQLIEFIIHDNDFIKNNSISCFAGYNKLIIEYKKKEDERYINNNYINNCLLLINPFQLIYNNYKSYIIAFKNNEINSIDLYRQILSQEINTNYYHLIKNINTNNIIDEEVLNIYINDKNIFYLFDNLYKAQNNNIIMPNFNKVQYNNNNINDLLKIFINLFYFNECLFNNKEKIFNKS